MKIGSFYNPNCGIVEITSPSLRFAIVIDQNYYFAWKISWNPKFLFNLKKSPEFLYFYFTWKITWILYFDIKKMTKFSFLCIKSERKLQAF